MLHDLDAIAGIYNNFSRLSLISMGHPTKDGIIDRLIYVCRVWEEPGILQL
jgi:hypothetical protein